MAERRQPDYDFFAPGQGAAQPPADGAAPRPDDEGGYGARPAHGGQTRYGTPTPYAGQGQTRYGTPTQGGQHGTPAPTPYGAPAQTPYGTPAQTPYGTPAQTPYGTPAQAPYGSPPPPMPPPGAQQYGTPPAWHHPQHPPGKAPRSRGATALIAAAVVVASLVVVGILAAIAIPVFLSQRMKSEWRSTTISMPETFDGGARTDVPESLVPKLPGDVAAQLRMAVYRTSEGVTLVVVAAKSPEPLSAEDQERARRDVVAGAASTGNRLTLSETDAGKLGGWFGCGSGPEGGTARACLATDSAGLVMVILDGSDDPVGDARRMREAVVRR